MSTVIGCIVDVILGFAVLVVAVGGLCGAVALAASLGRHLRLHGSVV
jgi:hypothetical protein